MANKKNTYWHFITDGVFDGNNVKECDQPCDYMDISFGYPATFNVTDNSSLTFYFRKSIPVRESHLAYPLSSLFAEIGGYMGLLLGFSFLDFANVVESFSRRIQTLGKRVGILNSNDVMQIWS